MTPTQLTKTTATTQLTSEEDRMRVELAEKILALQAVLAGLMADLDALRPVTSPAVELRRPLPEGIRLRRRLHRGDLRLGSVSAT